MHAASSRVAGYDVARAVAILGMVLVNYTSLMEVGAFSPSWLKPVVDWVYGRAAVVFVMLAGVSVSMMAARHNNPEALLKLQMRLFIRSVLLLIAGMVLSLWWHADILHFYALFIIVGARVAVWSRQKLNWAAAVILIISLPISAALTASYDMGDTLAWVENQKPALRLLLDYATSFYYPLFPWLGIFLLGMILGRREPTRPSFWRRVCLLGMLICLAAEIVSALSMAWVEDYSWEFEGSFWIAFLRSEAFPATPLFILSASGSGMAIIGLCRMIWPEPLRPSRRTHVLARFGQLSLTMYVAHIGWGLLFKHWLGGSGTGMTSGQMFLAMGIFDLAGLLFTVAWCLHFQRGPLETLFHRLIQGSMHPLTFMAAAVKAYPLRARP